MGTSSIMKLLRLFVGGLLLAAVQASNDLDTATSTLWNRVLQNIDSNNTSGSLSLRRLAPGDFDRLNAWFQNAQINLPLNHTYVHVFRLDFHEYHCENVSIGDVAVTYAVESASRMTVEIALEQLDFQCHMALNSSFRDTPRTGTDRRIFIRAIADLLSSSQSPVQILQPVHRRRLLWNRVKPMSLSRA